jgi:uncharacterized membrane protein YfcA
VRALIASPLGLLVGLSLGALGGGGSILAVPALVHGVGESAQAATTTSLLVVGVASLIGVIPHWRKGHVDLRAGVTFAAAGVGGSYVGTWLNRGVDGDVLLLAFAGFMVLAGVAMWRGNAAAATPAPALAGVGGTGAASPVERTEVGAAGDVATLVVPKGCDARQHPARCRMMKVVVTGTVVGALTGFFGVGGGFIIVPALVLSLGMAMPVAVGTSLVVIALNSAVALSMRGGVGEIDWAATLPFLGTAAIGTLIGGRIAERVDPRKLRSAFVWLLGVVAIITGAGAVLAITASA